MSLTLAVVFVALQSSYLRGKVAGIQFKTGEFIFNNLTVFRRTYSFKNSENDQTFLSLWNIINQICKPTELLL